MPKNTKIKPLEIVVVQSDQGILDMINSLVRKNDHYNITYTDDPVYTLNKVKQRKADIVITDSIFNLYSIQSGDALAENIKKQNPNIWVFMYDIIPPENENYFDAHIRKDGIFQDQTLSLIDMLNSDNLYKSHENKNLGCINKSFPDIQVYNKDKTKKLDLI